MNIDKAVNTKKILVSIPAFIPKVIVGIICVAITVGPTVSTRSRMGMRKVFGFLARGE